MQKNGIKLSVLTDNNNVFSEYNKDGKFFIEGRKNSSYRLKIENLTSSKKLVVVSIDSLSVINGQPADNNSPGYILQSFGSIIIDGWRISNDKIKKFEFSSLKNSYTNKLNNNTLNCGVIGVLVFDEKYIPVINYIQVINKYTNTPYWYNNQYGGQGIGGGGGNGGYNDYSTSDNYYYKSSANLMSSTTRSHQPDFNLGTAMGKEQISKVTNSSFNKLEEPTTLLELFYLTRKQLERMGIFPNKHIEINTPKAFNNDFCKIVS